MPPTFVGSRRVDLNTQIDPEPYQPYTGRISFKGFALRVGIVLVAYLSTAFTGIVVNMLLYAISNGHDDDHIDKVAGLAAIAVVILEYRFAASKFKFRKPGRIVRIALNITWTALTFFIVGGTVVIAIGHPNIGSGIAGVVAAVLVYMLVSRKSGNA